ncbi:MAG TPA: PspC domain-containing protein [Nakamurella sp.]|nr:PspC domain-containing protein [Nakamurella sp.]
MPLTPDGIPRLTRSSDHGVVAGVAAGISAHLGVKVAWVRIAFAVTAVLAGAGVVAYALLWIFVPQGRPGTSKPVPATPAERRQAIGIAAIGVALLIVATSLGIGRWIGWLIGPLGVVAVGAGFIWREADDSRRARWRRTAAGIVGPSRAALWRVIGGAVLVIGGLSVFAMGQLDFAAARSALIAVLLTLVGVAVITVPWWIRLVRDLGDERRERIRERERAEIAAHLHDSVLQTLALIQRKPGDAREVQRLARSQERELRTWLYGPAGYASAGGGTTSSTAAGQADPGATFAAALATAAGEIEDTYAISVAPVVVGDAPMDPHLAALVAAAREAMVNAAKHAGVGEVSVYAEVENGTASVFVRDRGRGFDPGAVDPDRRGLAQSIRGRMDRHGGTAAVRSAPGEGTEVVLTMPVTAPAETPSGPPR